MKYRYIAQPKFWKNYLKLTPAQRESVKKAWRIFKLDPFAPQLRTHRINSLPAILKRTIYAVAVEADLRWYSTSRGIRW